MVLFMIDIFKYVGSYAILGVPTYNVFTYICILFAYLYYSSAKYIHPYLYSKEHLFLGIIIKINKKIALITTLHLSQDSKNL